jgi:hypothetical protein
MNGAEEQKIMAYALFSDKPAFTDDGNPHDFSPYGAKMSSLLLLLLYLPICPQSTKSRMRG